MNPAVFLDRDGTINEEAGGIRDPAAVRLLPGAAAAIALLERAGYKVLVVTTQAWVGKGFLTEAEVDGVNAEIARLVEAESGGSIDGFYVCLHEPWTCACRKPNLGLYLRAVIEHDVDLNSSWCVGDNEYDVLPARLLNCRSVRLDPEARVAMTHAEAVYANLWEAAQFIISEVARPICGLKGLPSKPPLAKPVLVKKG